MITVNGVDVVFTTFPNGETKLEESSLNLNRGFNDIVFKYEGDADLIKLMFVKKYLDTKNQRNFLKIKYMPYSRMDRSEEGSAFTLKYVAEFINNLNFNHVEIIEPHSDVTPALIDRSSALYINFTLLPKVMQDVEFDAEQDYIMFPDAGASKRYNKLKVSNVIIGNKIRDFQTGEIKGLNLNSDFSGYGNKVIIVDDLSSYGGTFVKSAEALREKGFEKVFLLVAHAENSVFKGKLFEHIDHLYTTDSIVSQQDFWENAKFKNKLTIYKIEEVL